MARSRAYKLKGSYGEFDGSKVYYLGFEQRPGFLPQNGRGFAGLKHILEQLKGTLKKFSLTFTPSEDSIKRDAGNFKIRLSAKTVRKFGQRRWNESRELNLKLAHQSLAQVFPDYFTGTGPARAYQRGMFAEILSSSFDPRPLAAEDRTAMTKFVTEAVGSGASAADIPTAYKTSRDVQLLYLERLVQGFDKEVAAGHDEAWWQKYFSQNILFFQDNYIRRIEKLNVIVAGTQFPDFLVVTSDGYLDILEIKSRALSCSGKTRRGTIFTGRRKFPRPFRKSRITSTGLQNTAMQSAPSCVTTTTLIFGLLSHAVSSLPGRQVSLPASLNGRRFSASE